MTCYAPLRGYYAQGVNESGKRSVIFNPREAYKDLVVKVACGQCIGCRLDYSRSWAVRCVNEAQSHDYNCFITLTFDDEHINKDHTLDKSDFQRFMKRLRKKFNAGFSYEVQSGDRGTYKHSGQIRYFHAGEYGALCAVCGSPNISCRCKEFRPILGRPHHHACLFGIDFPDKYVVKVKDGVSLYRSATLEKLWPFGYATLGDVTFESAAYVARYVVKKIRGDKAEKHYKNRIPEFVTMSRKPGIGREYYEKYKKEIYDNDSIVVRGGITCKPPTYYDRLYAEENPEHFKKITGVRQKEMLENEESDLLRIPVKWRCKMKAIKALKREL